MLPSGSVEPAEEYVQFRSLQVTPIFAVGNWFGGVPLTDWNRNNECARQSSVDTVVDEPVGAPVADDQSERRKLPSAELAQ
jgi:hypothetical protein